eukprot:CAMPEP_0114555006 /NCGR_PEP_ID=MMETSP0114-20121206/8517_1 /TAXON_ID=31324 /ORGANISM="Goniomonas sp, Strain m" /LENGTH=399 /DNA_ID=CAMNT_0001740099 /DNA_START=1 /DNA_END=1200 /DNA_ORIENTATION=-
MGSILSNPVCNETLQRKGLGKLLVGCSDMQGFRRNHEDTHKVVLSMGPKHPNLSFFGVYDGHGGEEASLWAEAHLHDYVSKCDNPLDYEQCKAAVLACDAEFLLKEEVRDHGSAVVFCIVEPLGPASEAKEWRVHCFNIGDSRSIIVRRDGTLVEMSQDHKPDNSEERSRILAAGGTVSANRVDGNLALSRAMGDWQFKSNPSIGVEKQKVIVVPELTVETIREGDSLLLFCDGLVEHLTNTQVAKLAHDAIAQYPDDPAKVASMLIRESLQAGSKDNHSAMVVRFRSTPDAKNFEREDEFVAGPYSMWKDDNTFSTAYFADAKKRGMGEDRREELLALAERAEENMPQLPEAPGGGGLAGLNMLMGGGGDDDDDNVGDQIPVQALLRLIGGAAGRGRG